MNPLKPLEDLLTWILTNLHDTVGLTWAWSIVALVVIVRMLLVPLTVRQIHSMQNLQAHAPEMKKIQQQYKGDRQKMNAEMMAFYKENQINPAASCLPILAQFPIFIGLFFVLRDFEEEILPMFPDADLAWLGLITITEDTKEGWGPLLIVLYAASQLTSSYLMSPEHAAGAARDAADPADRVHPVRAQLPFRPDALLADDEPVDDGPGLDHPAPDAEAASRRRRRAPARRRRRWSRRAEAEKPAAKQPAAAKPRGAQGEAEERRPGGERALGRDDGRDRRRGEVGRAARARTDAARPRQGRRALPGRHGGRARAARSRLRAGASGRERRGGRGADRRRRPSPRSRARARARTPPACARSSSGSRTRSASSARSRSRRARSRSASSATATISAC